MYQPQFTISNKILKNIGLIEAAREIIVNAPLVPAWEAKFKEEAVVRTVHFGTHLEGNRLNLEEAAKVVEGKKIVAHKRDVQEVINYRNVLKYLDKKGEEGGEINEDVLKKIHQLTVEKILPQEECGQYRKKQVVIKNTSTGEVVFKPPPPIEVPYQIKDFLAWLKRAREQDVHPVLMAGITHYELARIHPFLDGNGRVARAVATLILFQGGYDIKKFFSLEEYFDKNPLGYYEALQSVKEGVGRGEALSREGLTPWLEYFTLGLAQELVRVKEKVQKLSTDQTLRKKLGGKQISLSERQIKIIEYIQKTSFLQNKAFDQLFPFISEDTVLRELKDLIKKGIIKKRGKTKAARYVLAA